MFDISTIGHLLYDIRCYVNDFPLRDRTVLTRGKIKYSAGGSACNSAVCSSNLEKKVAICGKIGFDDYGIFLIKNFISKKVDISNIVIDYHNPTGISVVIIDKNGQPEIVEMLGANEPIPIRGIKTNFFNTKLIHMTGTGLPILKYISASAKKKGIKVTFDPGRRAAAEGYKKLGPILENTDVVIGNKIEISHLLKMGENGSIEEIFKKIDALYPEKTFVVKQGAGETFVKNNNSFKVDTFKIKAVDTLGAGDTFAGALVTALSDKKKIEDSIVFANAAAAFKVTKEGAQSSPKKGELESFLELKKEDIDIKYL
ncbi:MAG TPA: carbohydrate kinase family protein [Thermoplasmata archaeon]|nr:carbohydrate kinase family protein [Thermoplasmata archaeon]